MKVLHFMPSLRPEHGGTTTYIEQLAPALSKGCELHVATLTSEGNVPLIGAEVHVLPFGWSKLWAMVREWQRLLTEIRPDIVHINCCWMLQCALLQRFTPKDIRVVLMPHGMLEPWIIRRHYYTKKWIAINLYQRECVRTADMLIATGLEERQHLLDLGWNDRISIVVNGIDTSRIPVVGKTDSPRLRLLYMSRLHPKKGLPMLFEALSEGMTLDIAGEGDAAYTAELKGLAEEARRKSGAEINFIGAVYGEKRWELYKNTDLLVLPSYSENFGLCVAEALATGTPVITTTGTPWGGLNDNRCGWCVAPETAAIRSALTDARDKVKGEQKSDMQKRAREYVVAHFDINNVASMMLKCYAEML